MVGFFSASVRGVLHSLKNLIEALLNPSKHGQLNSLTGMVSAGWRLVANSWPLVANEWKVLG